LKKGAKGGGEEVGGDGYLAGREESRQRDSGKGRWNFWKGVARREVDEGQGGNGKGGRVRAKGKRRGRRSCGKTGGQGGNGKGGRVRAKGKRRGRRSCRKRGEVCRCE
jgi:hypothetical protein